LIIGGRNSSYNERKESVNSKKRKKTISLAVNGEAHDLEVGSRPSQVSPWHTLAQTLRDTLGLTGTKVGCDHGACGSCTVLMDGKAVLSCMTLTIECDGKSVTTIEGIGKPAQGVLDPLQQAFVDNTAFQCGFCTPGIIMGAKALLDRNPSPEESEVKDALSGHFCRCISHYHVVRAVMEAAKKGS
jgi:aerobic-type carbon monoxide dehydrogenase small subunit (CoxS/CutS family)